MRLPLIVLFGTCLCVTACNRKTSTALTEPATAPAPAAPAPAAAEEEDDPEESVTFRQRTAAIPTDKTVSTGNPETDRMSSGQEITPENVESARQPVREDVPEIRRRPRANPETVQTAVNSGNATGTTAAEKVVDLSTATVLFEIRKTPCYGDCPVYTLEVLNNGWLRYTGKANVRNLGTYRYEPLSYQHQELTSAFRDFLATRPRLLYPDLETIPTDLSASVLEYRGAAGEPVQIRVYSDAPAEFSELLRLAEKAVESGKWARDDR